MSEGKEIPSTIGETADAKPVQLVGEQRLVSDNQTSRAIHATNRQPADEILEKGLMVDSRMGFDGVAVRLGKEIKKNLEQMENTHNNLPVIVLLAYPNIHREVVELKQSGKLAWEFAEETLFTTGRIAQEDTSGVQKTDTYFDSELIEGYLDKEKEEWVDNPNFWERNENQQARIEGLDESAIAHKKAEKWDALRQKALRRLQQESESYQIQQDSEGEDWWKDLPDEGVRIP